MNELEAIAGRLGELRERHGEESIFDDGVPYCTCGTFDCSTRFLLDLVEAQKGVLGNVRQRVSQLAYEIDTMVDETRLRPGSDCGPRLARLLTDATDDVNEQIDAVLPRVCGVLSGENPK